MSENPFECVPDGAYSWKERRSAFFFFGKTVSSLLLKFLLYCLFLAVTGSCLLHELSLVVVHGLPTAEASLAVVHRLWGAWTGRSLQHVGPVIVSRRPWSAGSVVVVHGLSCPERMLSGLLLSSPRSFK